MYNQLLQLYDQLAAGGVPSPWAYALVFAGGIASAVSPCYVPVLAMFAGYIGGYVRTAVAGAVAPGIPGRGLTGLRLALPFIAGNAVSLAAVGAVSAFLGASVLALFTGYELDRWIPGLVGLAMGLHLLGVLRLQLPGIPLPPALEGARPRTELGAFGIGVPFGVVVTPCTIPIFAAVVAFVAFQGGVVHGALLMVAYALGRGVILAAVAASAGLLRSLGSGRTSATVRRASGVLILVVSFGLLVFYNVYRQWIMPMPTVPGHL